MGNIMGLRSFVEKTTTIQVVNTNDTKIFEFRAPMRVKDLLLKYPNSYVGMFKEATQPLPLDYKLKLGNIYYLFPLPKREEVSSRRIKVVITRKQLESILSSNITLEDVIMEVKRKPYKHVSLVKTKSCNFGKLESVPEEVEGVY